MAGSGEKSLEISVRGFVILIDDEVSSIISSDLTRNYGSNPLSTSMFDANCIGWLSGLIRAINSKSSSSIVLYSVHWGYSCIHGRSCF